MQQFDPTIKLAAGILQHPNTEDYQTRWLSRRGSTDEIAVKMQILNRMKRLHNVLHLIFTTVKMTG